MKSDVEIYTLALVRVIHESREYKEFEAIKNKLKNEPELRKKIDQYRMESYRIQNYKTDEEDLYDKTEKFYENSKELRENPLVDEYLSCELAVCRMLQKIASKVVDSVDLELDGISGDLPSIGEVKA